MQLSHLERIPIHVLTYYPLFTAEPFGGVVPDIIGLMALDNFRIREPYIENRLNFYLLFCEKSKFFIIVDLKLFNKYNPLEHDVVF